MIVIANKINKLLKKADIYDNKLAITQILLRNGWEINNNSKITKKVKQHFKNTPDIFSLDSSIENFMLVKDRNGKVLSKVEISDKMNNTELIEAAKNLNKIHKFVF